MSKETMRSWVMSGFGRSNLSLAAQAIPQPGPGEVLVKVAAVSLNYRDRLVVENGMGMPLAFPFTPGSDLAGEVVATGPGVHRFASGNRVISNFVPAWLDGELSRIDGPYGPALGAPLPGVLSEYVVMKEDGLITAPASLDAVEASTLPVAGLTAWFALVELGGLKAGQSVLLQGTGGVSLFGLQIAAAHGAEIIITSGNAEKLQRAQALVGKGAIMRGIDRSRTPDWGAEAQRLTGGRGVDHLLEVAAGDLTQSLAAMKPGGRISAIGIIDSFEFKLAALPLLVKHVVLQGIFVGHRRALEDLAQAVDHLQLKPVIDRVYDFAELPTALDHLERGPFGKLVLRLR
ncbi:MAG TPA: NAD(P)-dependent alcohol dehydrogenase [Dongiaceae bacterium]